MGFAPDGLCLVIRKEFLYNLFLSEERSMDRRIGKLLIGLGAAVAAPLCLFAPGTATPRQRAPFLGVNYAHRGLHSRDKSVPENSLAAFTLAARAGYGAELDVRLTKDGQVVVFHDSTLKRVCGVDKRVDELTLAELRELRLCGTEQRIPLLTEALKALHGAGPLIVELKDGKHNRELCEKTYAILEQYRGEVCIESFNPFIVAWFRFHAPDLIRGQLAAPMKDYVDDGMKPAMAFALSHNLFNPIARPQFIAYKVGPRPLNVRFTEVLGAMRFCWTSHEPRNEKGRDGVIFEFYKPKLKFK